MTVNISQCSRGKIAWNLNGLAQLLSHVWLIETPWTVAQQAPLSVEFSRQEYWSQLPFLPPGDVPGPGIKPVSLALAGEFFTIEPSGKLYLMNKGHKNQEPVIRWFAATTTVETCSPLTSSRSKSVYRFRIIWLKGRSIPSEEHLYSVIESI